ncbi:amino acid permease [Thermoanaerobacter sp. A7A]|uniref:APC family permease n=1 Tax=Thermoanaerobacter sp. A7A TaxID=1350366 RepID=UPI0003F85385
MIAFSLIIDDRKLKGNKRIFTYIWYSGLCFYVGDSFLIIAGFFKLKTGYIPPEPKINYPIHPVTMILLLKAFGSGCTALTDVEAVANAVPNFKEPATKHAKMVLMLLSLIIFILFGGTSLLATYYRVNPEKGAMLVLMAQEVFGKTFMYYFVAATTFIILVFAANTAFAGFPMLVAVMAKEEFVPRQLSMKGDRLSYSNGIIILSLISALLIVIFKGNVSALIGLYAIGVFISFTLSQSGMFVRWPKHKAHKSFYKRVWNSYSLCCCHYNCNNQIQRRRLDCCSFNTCTCSCNGKSKTSLYCCC